jgi:hypothetical protein
MQPRGPLGAPNAQQTVITTYGPNPINPGRNLFQDAWVRIQGMLLPVVAGGDTDPQLHYTGVTTTPTDPVGSAANAVGTANQYRNRGGGLISELSTAEAGVNTPQFQAFAARAKRGIAR